MINLVGFKAIWWLLVLYGDKAILLAGIFLAIHILYVMKYKSEIYLLILVTTIGIFFDSYLHYFGVFSFQHNSHIPYWLMCLWACFATTLCHTFSFFERSKLLQFCFGGLLAPLGYITAAQFNLVEFGMSLLATYLLLAVLWGALFLIFFELKSLIISGDKGDKYIG